MKKVIIWFLCIFIFRNRRILFLDIKKNWDMKVKIFVFNLFKKGFNIFDVLIIYMIFNFFLFKFLNNFWLIGWGVFINV